MDFGGLLPTESWSFSSEKSYSPSKFTCPPGDHGTSRDRLEEGSFGLGVSLLGDLLSQVKVVPADDRIFDEAFAGLGDFLLLLFGLEHFPSVTNRDFSGESM